MSKPAYKPVFGPAMALAIALALGGGLAGCAAGPAASLVAGQATESEVLAARGQPVRVWSDADGGRTLEYSSQPFGRYCIMVKLDAAGRLVSQIDTLAEAERFRISPGMTPDEVSRRLGRERSRVLFPLSGEDVWDWTVASDLPSQGLRFNVHFIDGRVARISQSLVLPDERELPMR